MRSSSFAHIANLALRLCTTLPDLNDCRQEDDDLIFHFIHSIEHQDSTDYLGHQLDRVRINLGDSESLVLSLPAACNKEPDGDTHPSSEFSQRYTSESSRRLNSSLAVVAVLFEDEVFDQNPSTGCGEEEGYPHWLSRLTAWANNVLTYPLHHFATALIISGL
jgi:hypothetical protein